MFPLQGSDRDIPRDLWVNYAVFSKAGEFFHSSIEINRGEENFHVVIGCTIEYGSMSLRSNPN